jgi:myosin heavy subunit
MNVMGITAHDQSEIFRLLAAILYLGNVAFQNGAQDHAQIHDQQVSMVDLSRAFLFLTFNLNPCSLVL